MALPQTGVKPQLPPERARAARCCAAVLALVAAILSASCATRPVAPTDWPPELPPWTYFERTYQEDERNGRIQSLDNYMTWVIRFYKGWELYQDGWQAITRDILLSMDDDAARERISTKLALLGKRISGEWAKNSRDRAIRSRELSIWGQALVKSIDLGETEELIDRVERDVDALLTEEIHPAEITLKRYYEPDAEERARDS